MRLHHLGLTAFGPFPDSEKVDFDQLSEAGLFLLTGPTGAGKTTILDAVCFALYGTVPGVRGVKALRSQHAPAERRPEVMLEFSVRDRRFVVRRSPEWRRPKRRGDGFTTENASATLIEIVRGEEQLLSSRAQEVGHFIGDLIGMQSTQFVQVAMLPQGEFQRFLRASSQERHEVLQHLFRTDRYARIEEWVHDHSRSLKEHAEAARSAVVRSLDGIADRAGCEVPEELSAEALDVDDAAARARSWADEVLAAASASTTAAGDQHAAAQAALDEARRRHDEARRTHDLLERRDRAVAELAALEAEAEAAVTARRRLDADGGAARCRPLLRMLDDAAAEVAAADTAWSARSTGLSGLDLGPCELPAHVTGPALVDLQGQLRSRGARLEALLPRERELREASGVLAEDAAALDSAREQLQESAEQLADIPPARSAAEERLAAATAGAARREVLTVELDRARQQASAAVQAEECAQALARLLDDERAARDSAADAREHVQALTARRLAGIAAELAGRLGEGQPCQVCGNTEHPALAQPSHDAVTEAEQAHAEAELDAATSALSSAAGSVLQMRERLDALRSAAAGRDAATSAEHVAGLEQESTEAERAETRRAEAASELEELQERHARLSTRVHELTTRVATLEQSVDAGRRTVDALTAELTDALGQDHVGSLHDEISRTGRLTQALEEARVALDERDAALARRLELVEQTAVAAAEEGFDGIEELRAAVLPAPEREHLEALLASRAEAAARARSVLDDPQIRDLDDAAGPDLALLGEELRSADEAASAAARDHHTRAEARDALSRHRQRLDQALAAWSPVREEHLRADAMAKLVRGMGADNQLQMRLSAYVLATRLDQVVAAANERLAHMRDQRYLLQRTGRAARRGAQAGLGLEVVDQWTGDVRDPATLSGGETFVVSLALALGLADVVTQEAGGTEIETLFVDEGFGSLDPDTLDDVMDRLDDLRSGGRAVGVVSHVSELRNRIPTQLHVDKGRNGSVVLVRTAVG